ncbi:uncharacterized protein G2W53_023973 [Senna tora]|uniref:Uncharacterized protein n=1 Tax=Senna tora TaxID=362788 RepID=A0A834TAF0_9FABA|nr:uncharacterized protein G2W53_023973 [Senna tora]
MTMSYKTRYLILQFVIEQVYISHYRDLTIPRSRINFFGTPLLRLYLKSHIQAWDLKGRCRKREIYSRRWKERTKTYVVPGALDLYKMEPLLLLLLLGVVALEANESKIEWNQCLPIGYYQCYETGPNLTGRISY